MSDFMQLSETEQAERLRHLALRALEQWGMSDADVRLIKIRENAVYSATRPNGERYAVRVHRADYHSDAALASELAWMRELNEVGIHTPDVIPATDGALFKRVGSDGVPETRQVDVLGWVEGEQLGTVEGGIEGDDAVLVQTFEAIGELAAHLHNQTESWSMPEDFTRSAFDVEGLTGEDPHWGRFWENALLTESQRELVLRGRAKLRTDLAAFGTSADRFGLIHADLLPENLLVGPDTTRLIDFDDSVFGWHLFDLSTPLFFHLGEPYFDTIVEALIRGYRKHRELPDAHVAMLPMFLVARGTTYLGWMHTRPESETAREIGPAIVAGVVELIEAYLQDDS